MLLAGRAKDLGDPPLTIEFNRSMAIRVNFLIGLESLINVGCHFGPNDLAPEVWNELQALSIERAFVDRLVDTRRDARRAQEQEQSKARSATGIIPPGGTLFPHSKPFTGNR